MAGDISAFCLKSEVCLCAKCWLEQLKLSKAVREQAKVPQNAFAPLTGHHAPRDLELLKVFRQEIASQAIWH